MCDWGGGPNEISNYVRDSSGLSPVERAEQATREARGSMQKNAKPPIQPQPEKDKQPVIIKGTIEPTTKK
jgi:hypothetical protein